MRHKILALTLLACGCSGSDSGGGVITPTPTPSPSASASPSPSPSPSTTPAPASACPNGTSDAGVIAGLRDCRVPATVTFDTTLTPQANLVYSISGATVVTSTLRLQAGATLYAATPESKITVQPGGTLYVLGQAGEGQQVVFTSAENIRGEATETSSGQWGGIEMLGTSQMEYAQIRYAGRSGVSSAALTLKGSLYGNLIGIQVHNSGGDGVVLGGSARLRLLRLTVTGAAGAAIREDGATGTAQFVVAVQRPGVGDRIVDFAAGSTNALGFYNFTFVQRGATANAAIAVPTASDFTLANGVITSGVAGASCIDVDDARTRSIRSVLFSCARFDDPDADSFETATLSQTGNTNNVQNHVSTLTNVYVNGANETAATGASYGNNMTSPLENDSRIGTPGLLGIYACTSGFAPTSGPACTAAPVVAR